MGSHIKCAAFFAFLGRAIVLFANFSSLFAKMQFYLRIQFSIILVW